MTKPFEVLNRGDRLGPIPARITGIRELARRVREFRLDCHQIDWEPGAHIDVEVTPGTVRQYSLCGDPSDESLIIAVQREDQGRGGSSAMHALDIGDVITIHAVRNTFPLQLADEYLFIACGIGITPFLPMLRAAPAARLLYGGRTLADMAYADELLANLGDRVRLWPEDRHGRPPLAEAIGARGAAIEQHPARLEHVAAEAGARIMISIVVVGLRFSEHVAAELAAGVVAGELLLGGVCGVDGDRLRKVADRYRSLPIRATTTCWPTARWTQLP